MNRQTSLADRFLPGGVTMTDRAKALVNRLLAPLGYEVNNLRRARVSDEDERINQLRRYTFMSADGSFDYETYRKMQAAKNRKEIDILWAKEANMQRVGEYLLSRMKPTVGLCHGAKKGTEVEWLRKCLPNCQILGTDISETARDFPGTMIQWDFHEAKEEWIGSTDFIYTNALDHSYDPEKALNAWVSCLRPGGAIVVEWSNGGEALSVYDPFSADVIQLVYAITRWGKGVYGVREVFPAPSRPKFLSFVVVQKY